MSLSHEFHRKIESKKRPQFNLEELILLVFGVVLLIGTINFIGLGDIIQAAKSLSPWLILSIFLIDFFVYVILSRRLQMFTKKIAPIRYSSVFLIYISALVVNNLTPGPGVGGEPVRAYYISKETKKSMPSCLSAVIMDGLVQSSIFFVLGFLSLIFLLVVTDLLIVKIVISILILVMIIGARIIFHFERESRKQELKTEDKILAKIYKIPLFQKLFHKFKTLKSFEGFVEGSFDHLVKKFKEIERDRIVIMKTTGLTLVSFLFIYLKDFIIIRGLGGNISFLHVVIVISVAGIIGFVLLLPGGTGGYELSMISIYGALGLNLEIAAAATLISRAVYYFYNYLVSYLALMYLGVHYNK